MKFFRPLLIICVIFVPILVLAVFMGYIKYPRRPDPVVGYPKHPDAIDQISKRVLTNQAITVEKTITTTDNHQTYLISYPSDNFKLYALMSQPVGTPPEGGWPVVVVNHGYIPPNHYSTTSSYINTFNYFASQGFVVLKPDYRGHDNSEGGPDPILGRLQYAVDVLNLIADIKSINEANPNKIFLFGHSMGGDVALMVAEASPQIKALVLWAPAVTTFPENITYFMHYHLSKTTDFKKLEETLNQLISQYGKDQFSSFSNATKINIPIILQQGNADESVPFTWGEALNKHLKSEGKNITFYQYPSDNHNISNHWYDALSKDVEFFKSF
ncbi:MAG: alpha/beta fold hydrolase [Candidatus Shapirobacteria bacterium]|nr:alpha/beta fold hydrolase [Candidatus Shapirobacteria bacterium]